MENKFSIYAERHNESAKLVYQEIDSVCFCSRYGISVPADMPYFLRERTRKFVAVHRKKVFCV